MGTDASFAVLAGSTVTNTGPSVISGSLGLSPGTAITGFPPGIVVNGTEHAADGVALQAKNDLVTAYNDAAGRTPVTVDSNPDLGGDNLAAGVYKGTSTLSLTGTLTLNGQNNANSVFIFQAGSTLITASSSTVSLVNGATWCNVFWQVGSSATLGTGTTFVGTVMALTSGTLNTGGHRDGPGAGPQRRRHPGRQHHHPARLHHVDDHQHHRHPRWHQPGAAGAASGRRPRQGHRHQRHR